MCMDTHQGNLSRPLLMEPHIQLIGFGKNPILNKGQVRFQDCP
jgi:hypothetical protein